MTRGLAIILAEGELTSWRRNSIGLAALERTDLKVAYLDCEPLVRPKSPRERLTAFLESEISQLQQLLNADREVFVFSYYNLADERLRPIRDLLEEARVPWCRVFAGFVPIQCPPTGIKGQFDAVWFRLLRLVRQVKNVRALRDAMWDRVTQLLTLKSQNRSPKYVLLEGLAARQRSPHPRAIPIFGHSRDYEHALALGLLPRAPDPEANCVFLDSNEARHEDFGILGFGRRDVVDETWYREALQRSFQLIEEVTGLRVVIAPHPRYQYPAGYFGSFEVRAGDTVQTVASSKLVIGHYSTSLGLAVIFNKPAILLNSRPMMERAGGFTGRYIKGFQQALGCPMLDMDRPDPKAIQDWKSVDPVRYAEFRDRYVKYPGGPDGSMWENAVRTIARHEGWNI